MKKLKQWTASACLVATLLCGISCRDETPSSPENPAEFSSVAENVTVTADPSKDEGYLTLEQAKVQNTKAYHFYFGEDDKALQLPLPVEWTFTSDGSGGYLISRDGRQVGQLLVGEARSTLHMVSLKNAQPFQGNVTCRWDLLMDPEEPVPEERYLNRLVYTYESGEEQRMVTVLIKYTELEDFYVRKCRVGQNLVSRKTEEGYHSIRLPASAKGKTILILGNSFVNSSRIGYILREMCASQPYEVVGVSVGYATVSKSWSSYLSAMRNGEYAAVLMCGFYGSSDVAAFEDYVDACRASGTPIAILPAHNEQYGETAATRYPNVPYLNWKGEIDALIKRGVDWDDFCVNDTHKHSKPLAGYVGAHMIYRALFGENPPTRSNYDTLTHSYVSERLGNYIQDGYVSILEDQACYLLG